MADFTALVRSYVRSHPDDRDLRNGALLVLRISGNQYRYRALLDNIPASADDILADLQDYLRRRDAVPSAKEAQQIRAEAAKIIQAKSQVRQFKAGKRADHDSLPPEIQQIFEQNMAIKRQMSQYHLEIRNLLRSPKACASADLKVIVGLLKTADIQYRQNWEKYDGYKGQDNP